MGRKWWVKSNNAVRGQTSKCHDCQINIEKQIFLSQQNGKQVNLITVKAGVKWVL